MIKMAPLLNEYFKDTNVWYHGSPSGDLRGGRNGLHLGTFLAGKQALEARIGIPVKGEWAGTREYGKTLLCGKNTLKERHIFATGFNCDVPTEDLYPAQSPKHTPYLTLSLKPAIRKYKILCPLTNTQDVPYYDETANKYMYKARKRGNAKMGYYYVNAGEDAGSISVVVPDGSGVREI